MTNPDIVLLQTQRLTDNANGGGQMTSTIIPDNQANNLFGPISRVNRADGNVSLRKAIVKALSADTKTYFGAHAIIASPPENDDVTALMFSTGSWTDLRSDAVEFVESYLVQGPQTRLWPYGQQVVGQRSIIAYQPVSDPLPSIGDSYVIVYSGVTPNRSQFVRVRSLTNAIQTFTDSIGPYQLNIVTMGITEPLLATYPGAEAQRFSTPVPDTVMHLTNVADAATYYGVEKLSADVSIGAETATLESVFAQLVPSSQGEAPITNASPQGAFAFVAIGPPISTTTAASSAGLFLGRSILPGSLNFQGHLDDGTGKIPDMNLEVDYIAGRIAITNPGNYALTYTPAVHISQSGFSSQQPVTEATRGYLWIETLNPLPTPGSTTVSYRALGKWFTLQDDGSGNLVGPIGAGAGTVRFDTGIVTLTTGALPDIDSNVIFAWGQGAQYTQQTGDLDIQPPAISIKLSHSAKPSSVTITWLEGTTTRTVTDNGSSGLTGYGTGTIEYGSGAITLRPTFLPTPGAGISVSYLINPATNDSFTPTKSGADISITLSSHPVAPESVLIKYEIPVPATWPSNLFAGNGEFHREIVDDGVGGLIDNIYGVVAGSINYTTGVVSFNPDLASVAYSQPVYGSQLINVWNSSTQTYDVVTKSILLGWENVSVTAPFINGSTVTATSTAASASNTSTTESFPTPSIVIDLTPKTVRSVVPESVVFVFSNDGYIDRAGILYRSVSTLTGSGTAAGTIDYTTGIATITGWNAGNGTAVSVKGLLCENGLTPIGTLAARVPGQAVRPSSFHIQANRVSDSALVTATADASGNWSTADMTGHIDVATGFYTVAFGQLVLDSSLTSDDKAQPWYNSDNVDGTGHIWRPNEALPGSVKYSCVVQTILPLNASVLGLDPVRLPSDGRVQIIGAGNTLVFRNPLTYTFTGTKIAGDTITLPRGSLESVVLYDSDGVQVDIALYTSDLTAGTVTIANPADLSAYTQPFVATHTRGEMVLCTDAEITGQIAFSPPLVNSYPASSSFVSSALIFPNAGNLQADYDTLFEQNTWTFNPNDLWDDVVHGTPPLSGASFNDIDFPIQVLDRDTITQRVALVFTSSGGGNIVFEELGIIGTFTTSANVAPVNPATSNPYFVIDHRAFGSGWANGNAVRFDLRGAGGPIWFIRSVQVGASATLDDSFATELRWDE